jgi:RND family efflux transporter MFP subunit
MNAITCKFRNRISAPGIVACGFVLVAGCAPEAPVRSDAIRPVKTMVVSAGEENLVRSFPGKAEASRKAELAFQVSGLLVELPVKEGQSIGKGGLIGQLRKDEFEARLKSLRGQLDQARAALRALQSGDRPEQRLRLEAQVRAAEAKLANARAEANRAQQLMRTNSIARADFDLAMTSHRVAQEEHQAAMQLLEKGTIARAEDIEAQQAVVSGLEGQVVEANIQLADTTLRAPFDGVIAKRFVEPNQNIKAKTPIVKFQDVDEIDVAVDVPESMMASDLRTADIVVLVAEFTALPGLRFPVQIREIAQRADPVTQTFRVRAAMKAPPENRVLPGMTANVTATLRRAGILGNRIFVPISAVFKEESGGPVAWVIGTDGKVSRRSVKIGVPSGGRLEIVEGLEPGDRIAVAGVPFLRDGMTIRDLGDALGGS